MGIRRLVPCLLAGIFLAIPVPADAADSQAVKTLQGRLDHLNNSLVDSQAATLDLLDTVADSLAEKIRILQKDLQNDTGIRDNLDVSLASLADVEKTRRRLKRDIEEWTADLGTTDLEELRRNIGDALAVAHEDGLDTEKLISIYNLTKKIIRNSTFREAPRTVFDITKNLDLEYAETAASLRKLDAKWKSLQRRIEELEGISEPSYTEIWSLNTLKLDQLAVEADALQLRLGIEGEDIARPVYVLMDGILSGLVTLSWLSAEGRRGLRASGLESHEFDRDAPWEMAAGYTVKLLTIGSKGEEFAREAARARRQVRRDFYKRSAIAFIRALISRQDEVPACRAEAMPPTTAEHLGEQIKVLGCPDPVVDNLRKYLGALKKMQEAETDLLMAEAEMLVAEQQIIADFLAVVPLVGEAMDIYSVYAGENLAGVKFSPLERGFMGVAVAIPIVGPHAFKQALKFEAVEAKMEVFGRFFVALTELASDISTSMKVMGKDATERFLNIAARETGIEVSQLKRMMIFYREAPYVFDDAARARMKLFKTMRDASEDRMLLSTLAGSDEFADVLRRARAESDTLLRKTLLARQGKGKVLSHMPESHKKAFLGVAKERRQAYVFRPVGRDAAKLLDESFAATKGLGLKPKSANWGPQSAFIPVEQEFSKLGKRQPGFRVDADEIAKYNAKAQACLAMRPPCANTVPLKVKVAGEVAPLEIVIVKQDGLEVPVYRNAKGDLLHPETRRPFRRGEVDASKIRPLDVFADADGNPLTADYDLQAVGSRRDVQAPSSARGPGYDETTARQVPRSAGDQGTISEEMAEAVEHLNRSAREEAGFDKGNLVHHGADTFNPATEGVFTKSEMSEGLTLTVLDPDRGELAIPACDYSCMTKWCKDTGFCDPNKICPDGVVAACIPVDKERLLKDYFHDARLRNIDIFPHSSWRWGNYNLFGGWTMTSFLGVPPKVAETATGGLFSALAEMWQETLSASLYRRLAAPSRVMSEQEQGQ